ncbi:MAG: InlB B-repeat-containing protein, partial [Oscillibacter sp.]|nr:InlB B-repeat-containing protein [Oscillibacter sp.]
VGIVNYAWDFGDDSTASGEDATASHDFAEEGTYTVTLTVRDAAGNSHSATAAVTVVADGDAVKLTALDTVSGKPVAGATISVTDGAGNTAQYAAGADGKVFLSAENGTYTVAASADGYQNRTFSVTVADDKRAFDVYLNAADVLRVETKVKELTKEEAVAAGIDTEAPENQHVYRSTAVFAFGELTYIHNDSEVLDYTPLKTGKITAYPVARDIYLIVYSQVNWLKELFRVQLYVQNTSNFEHIEDCAANLTLPEGLSLAVMTEDKDPQSLEVSLGTIDPGSEIGHNWYLCGDAAGEYTLSGSVSGVRANADNTVREDTSAEFTTSEPISVLAGSAMTLTITAEKYGVIGLPYHVAYELENVSEKTLYDVTLDVMGGQFVEDYDATDLEYDPDGKASGSLQSGFSVYDETFGPGEKLSGVFTIKFGKGLDIPRGMEYVLKDMFLWTDPESTTQIPTTFTLTNNERILLTYDANGGSGEMEAQLATKSLEASSFVYTLPECTLAAPENQHFKDWLVGETEYAPGDECTLTEDATILAVWEDDEEEYEEGVERTVTFNAAGGTVETAEKTVIAGQAYGELPVPARDHYTFAGWYTSADGGTVVTADDTALLSRDVTLYAHWTPLPYTITWVDEDGTTLATAEVPYGETPEYSGETPVKAQDELFMYEFAGWTPEVGPVSGETTYTARYDEISKLCTVTWFNYDGTPLETDENVAFGRTPEYNGETPERPPTGANSYEFIGWTPEVAPVNGDTAYMATYRTVPRTHTVTWLDEDGTVLATDEVAYGETPVYSGATPVKATDERYEYEFSGWKTTPRPIREDMTYEAAYTQTLRRYTITWLDEDGTELGTTEVPYGQIPAYDGETPRKEPTDEETYILAGWTPTLEPVSGEATYTARYRPSISASIEEVSIGEDGTITVRLECSEPGASILCGIYDENDQLIALQSLPVSEEGLYSFQFGDAFHYVKVFAMDANARALCENVQVPSAKE